MRKGGANAPPHYAVLEIRRILMKRRLFPLAAVALLLCMLFFIFSPSTAHADALDPYDSGCANTGYVANSGTLSVAGYVVYAENWYSTGCNTNWAEIWEWGFGSTDWSSNLRVLWDAVLSHQLWVLYGRQWWILYGWAFTLLDRYD